MEYHRQSQNRHITNPCALFPLAKFLLFSRWRTSRASKIPPSLECSLPRQQHESFIHELTSNQLKFFIIQHLSLNIFPLDRSDSQARIQDCSVSGDSKEDVHLKKSSRYGIPGSGTSRKFCQRLEFNLIEIL